MTGCVEPPRIVAAAVTNRGPTWALRRAGGTERLERV